MSEGSHEQQDESKSRLRTSSEGIPRRKLPFSYALSVLVVVGSAVIVDILFRRGRLSTFIRTHIWLQPRSLFASVCCYALGRSEDLFEEIKGPNLAATRTGKCPLGFPTLHGAEKNVFAEKKNLRN